MALFAAIPYSGKIPVTGGPLEVLTTALDNNLACGTGFDQRMRGIDVRH